MARKTEFGEFQNGIFHKTFFLQLRVSSLFVPLSWKKRICNIRTFSRKGGEGKVTGPYAPTTTLIGSDTYDGFSSWMLLDGWSVGNFILLDYEDVIPRNVFDIFICCFFLITSFTVLTKIPNFCGHDLISVNVKCFCQNVHEIRTKYAFLPFI